MGAFADAFAAYAQPLIDESDGSLEQMEKICLPGQLCWNLALEPEDTRRETLADMQRTFRMDDDAFEAFKTSSSSR